MKHPLNESIWRIALGQLADPLRRRIPAEVIVSEKTPFDDPVDADAWRAAHAQFAARADNRKLIIADKSSHDVAHDRPDVIVTAISDMIDRVRQH